MREAPLIVPLVVPIAIVIGIGIVTVIVTMTVSSIWLTMPSDAAALVTVIAMAFAPAYFMTSV